VGNSGGARASGFPLDSLAGVMDRLLGPEGCPWDREQSHTTLRPYVVEEAYEVVEAIDSGDPARLKDELGDLLLQVVFHAALARRDGQFDLNDITESIESKLVRRHPHVFGDSRARSAEAVLRQWEDIKSREAAGWQGEGQRPDAAIEAPLQPRLESHLPVLMQAQKLLERAARLGRPAFASAATGPSDPDRPAPRATAGSAPALEAGFGESLLVILDQARRSGIDAELALRQACLRLARELSLPARDNL
jgi:uncharacterized protein YabN with tetrapyrrole methylase and pyrophosphatase domain